jgi:guanylate kinase
MVVRFAPTVVVGPSGVGKGTIVSRLASRYPCVWVSVSATTRPPRPREIDGVSYHFVSDAQFDTLIAEDGLLEWATVHGSARYGTPLAPVAQKIDEGRAVVLELDYQGARQTMARLAQARSVFIAPPSWEELERRLRGRGTESAEVIARRLETARLEMETIEEWSTVIVNREVEEALAELVEFIGLRPATSHSE